MDNSSECWHSEGERSFWGHIHHNRSDESRRERLQGFGNSQSVAHRKYIE